MRDYLPLKNLNLINKKSIVLGSGGSKVCYTGINKFKFFKNFSNFFKKSSIDKLIKNFRNQIEIQGLLDNDNRVENLIEEADLIVNTTPVGMKQMRF